LRACLLAALPQGVSASMQARRSRSQQVLRWERGRPARYPDWREKTYPFKGILRTGQL